MKIYISTPINGRPGNNLDEKLHDAFLSAERLIHEMETKPKYADAQFISTFTLHPMGARTEAKAMGRCIQAVIESDIVVMDDGWQYSKGCKLELAAAKLYGKEWIFRENIL